VLGKKNAPGHPIRLQRTGDPVRLSIRIRIQQLRDSIRNARSIGDYRRYSAEQFGKTSRVRSSDRQ
jgi:hypothetical protein